MGSNIKWVTAGKSNPPPPHNQRSKPDREVGRQNFILFSNIDAHQLLRKAVIFFLQCRKAETAIIEAQGQAKDVWGRGLAIFCLYLIVDSVDRKCEV